MALWDNQAKKWMAIGAPLRPSSIDIKNKMAWMTEYLQPDRAGLSVVILGVTPELIHIPWPRTTRLFAIENNHSMIDLVMPKFSAYVKPQAIAGDWLHLPLQSASIDIVLGDGSYTLLQHQQYAQITSEIRRVLKPDGCFIMRFFSRAVISQTIEEIKNKILQETNFHAFKFKLAMALHKNLQQGVCVKQVWECWQQHFFPHKASYKQKLNWTDAAINTIDNYKDMNVIYTFPTLDEIRANFHPWFIEEAMIIPAYDFGERCPTFKFRKKEGA